MGLVAVEVDATPEDEIELVAQTVDEPPLGRKIAHWGSALQVHELPGVDARLRRIAVDEQQGAR